MMKSAGQTRGARWAGAGVLLLLVIASCSDDEGDPPTDGAAEVGGGDTADVLRAETADMGPGDGTGGDQQPGACPAADSGLDVACVSGTRVDGGQNCGNTSTTAMCLNGEWVCPVGTFPARFCTCFGPSCVADAGASDLGSGN